MSSSNPEKIDYEEGESKNSNIDNKINIQYNKIYNFQDYLDQLELSEKNHCKSNADRLLRLTGHLPKVINIATGAGFCIYKARLQEAIGVKNFISSIIPGKGKAVHKLLGLASLEIFLDKQPMLQDSYYKNLYDRYKELLPEMYDKNKEDILETSMQLIKTMYDILPNLLSLLGLVFDDLFPIVENQMYDYDLHMLGVPDLILENREKKKAIVVEWKTYDEGNNVSDIDKAQVIAYALLEAKRLGFDNNKAIEAVTGKFENGHIKDISVLPIIIRPKQGRKLQPHPALWPDYNEQDYNEFKELLGKVLTIAGYLTLQLINPTAHGTSKEDLNKYCEIKLFNQRYNALWLVPQGKIWRGKPSEVFKALSVRNKPNKWPCKSCTLNNECAFYLGKKYSWKQEEKSFNDEEGTLFDKIMWKLRYITLGEKETMNLRSFKAIYEISKLYSRKDLIEKIRDGIGFKVTENYDVQLQYKKRQRILIDVGEKGQSIVRIDAIDELCNNRIDSTDFDSALVLCRKIRNYEKDNNKIRIVSKGKPVLFILNDGASYISLSLNLTARVDEVEIDSQNVKYYISIPSGAFRYSFAIMKKYLQEHSELIKDSLLIETGVDLTSRELMVIDALQRMLRKEASDELKDENEKNEIKETLNKLTNQIEGAQKIYDNDISDIISKLLSSVKA